MNTKGYLSKLWSLLLVGVSVFAGTTQAQVDKRPKLSLAQCTNGSPEALYPAIIPQLQWFGDDYIYAKDNEWLVGKPQAKVEERVLLDLKTLQQVLSGDSWIQSLNRLPWVQTVALSGKPTLQIYSRQGVHYIDPATKSVVAEFRRVENASASLLSPSGKVQALVVDHNIQLLPAGKDGQIVSVTTDGKPSLVYGESVHQNEFGISGGLFWSPDGNKLAFYRMNQSMVQPVSIPHINTRKQSHTDQYYPMAGLPIHEVTIGIYDLQKKTTLYLQTKNPSETYLTNVAWSPDSKAIYVAEVNRAQTLNTLNRYSADSGALEQTLFTEENSIYIEPQYPVQFVPGKPNQFVWLSRRDGWMHAYLYNTQGKLLRQLTKGNWEIVSPVQFLDGGASLCFTATKESPLDRDLYSVSLSGKSFRRLTQQVGIHRTQLSASGKFILDELQSPTIARRNALLTATGKELRILQDAPNPEADYQNPEIEVGTIKAADKTTDLYYRLIKPVDFDPNKKYPTIVYVYGGPHAQLITNTRFSGAGGWDRYMASLGYVIFTVDSRGSANRGAAFEQVIHRQLGTNEMADQMQGVEFLKSLPYVDTDRMGVYGWSFGGFMATNLMLTHGDVFKVGVAGGAVIDWSRYEAMYGERYMDTPQENPEGYKANNLTLRAGDLKGRLLLIHGTIDPVVLWQHSLLFVQACVGAHTLPDYMVYPEHEHNVRGVDRVHLYQTITRYFQDHL